MFDTDTIKKNISEMAALSPADWDAICKNCGICCLYKINVNGETKYSRYACQHCDLKTKLCKRYQERLTDDACIKITLRDVIAEKCLPDSCAYVEKIFGPADTPAQVDWDEIKQNAGSFEQMEKSVFPESTSWITHTDKKIIPELLEFLDKLQ